MVMKYFSLLSVYMEDINMCPAIAIPQNEIFMLTTSLFLVVKPPNFAFGGLTNPP